MTDITITAKFTGTCPVCDQPTRKGTRITKHAGEWAHETCAANYDRIMAETLAAIAEYNPIEKARCISSGLGIGQVRWTLGSLQRVAAELECATPAEYRTLKHISED